MARGQVKVFKISPKGEEYILHIQKNGELIAEASIFDTEKYPAHAQTLEETVIVKIPAKEFKAYLSENIKFTFKILSAYSKRLRYFTHMIEELTSTDVKGRLAGFLIRNSAMQNGKLICNISITKKELAKSLGTIPETLSRTLKYFKNESLIEENDEGIIILDAAQLKKII